MEKQSVQALRDLVRQALKGYFKSLDGEAVSNLYDLVLTEVEVPLLEIVMQETKGNQSLAARWLGLNRLTLRKLLKKYSI